jgi:CDP-diacylglycerol--glycerol-3-phosphate 3-phosphatidyltransferase
VCYGIWSRLSKSDLSLMLAAVRTCVRRRSNLTHAYLSHYSKPRSFRQFSTSHLDPSIRDFARSIVQTQPCVAMSADDVHILSEPTEFHRLLLVSVSVIWFFSVIFKFIGQDMIHRAQRRIFISSLYIGSEENELVCFLFIDVF